MSDDKQKILAVYQRIDDAMVNKDTKALDDIFDDDYKFVQMMVINKVSKNGLNK